VFASAADGSGAVRCLCFVQKKRLLLWLMRQVDVVQIQLAALSLVDVRCMLRIIATGGLQPKSLSGSEAATCSPEYVR
jgi:hypothetical protein